MQPIGGAILVSLCAWIALSVIGLIYVDVTLRHHHKEIDQRMVAMERGCYQMDQLKKDLELVSYRIDQVGVKVWGHRKWQRRTADQ